MHIARKYFFYLITLACFGLVGKSAFSQDKSSGEFGLTAGGSYYLGDINKIPFVGTRFSAGAFYRHTFDTRLAVAGNFAYGKLSGDDAKSKNEFQQNRDLSFINPFYELEATGEFNFLQFLPGKKKKYLSTPYIFAGLGVTYYPGGSKKFIMNIPFGAGVKYNISTNIMLGGFVGMRKTFVDNIDYDYTPPTPNAVFRQFGYAGNKDWYSVFGVSLSYKIKYRMKCPAFD